MKFNTNGEILSEWIYGSVNQKDVAQGCIQTNDEGILIIGATTVSDTLVSNLQAYTVKVDNLGNLEWQREYGGG